MVITSKKITLPERGKAQLDLTLFNYSLDYRDSLFTLYLPCSKDKPYYKSKTHSYIKKKLNENIPKIWHKLIRICTISEVIGIIPESLESRIFYFYRDQYYYEHYPTQEEGDLERTSGWLKDYVKKFGSKFNYGYCTCKIFRDICVEANLDCFPTDFKKESALFEFRKTENVMELINKIKDTYINLLISRFNRWKNKKNHAYQVIKYAKTNNPFSFKEFKNTFNKLRNPKANVNTFCHESRSDKGVFFYYNRTDKKYYFPIFISKFLDNKI